VPNPEPLYNLMTIAIARIFPDGGQRTARQNAWAAMSTDATRARDRREADLALAAMTSDREPAAALPPSAAMRASSV
jgi:hypothetical protein